MPRARKNWMACVRQTRECTIVPKNHYGPVPGVRVGTRWKFRVQVSEAGVHRSIVAGIHGRAGDGAYSIILSNGYEDDVDYGLEFVYTGSGGRDFSSNKQIRDQVLEKSNKALALNCNAPFNLNGAEAEDWKAGRPVRVVRNYKCSENSEYGPEEGNRYDGIYKVVKYYPEKGKSGFLVWRYLLRRDDPEPAPWEEGGEELEMYWPGYLGRQAQALTPRQSGKRRGSQSKEETSTSPKRLKKSPPAHKLENSILRGIEQDTVNSSLWDECMPYLQQGRESFLEKVEELFKCVCCLGVPILPLRIECKHIVCKDCLATWKACGRTNCPYCRRELVGDEVNKILSQVLLGLFLQ